MKSVGYQLAAATAFALAAAAAGCEGESEQKAPEAEIGCDAGNYAFVRRAIPSLLGRPAKTTDEVRLWAEAIEQLTDRGSTRQEARGIVARAIMSESDTFVATWSDFMLDALKADRSYFAIGDTWDARVRISECWGPSPGFQERSPGALATWMASASADDAWPTAAPFRLGDLLPSALLADNVSVLYRAQLFNLMRAPQSAANLEGLDREASRRLAVGPVVDDVFLRRDPNCVPCHNAVFSTTYSDDPAENRYWPLPGRIELALFGTDQAGDDLLAYRSVFRFDGVRQPTMETGRGPWGWDPFVCTSFERPATPDPLDSSPRLGGASGNFASVWDLEQSLHRGITSLAGTRPQWDAQTELVPDEALAYAVASSFAEKVWEELMGHRLTVNYYASRNADQQRILADLTATVLESNFSLQRTLEQVVQNPLYNLPAADSSCFEEAFPLPAVANPWSADEDDDARRGNSVGDFGWNRSPRQFVTLLHHALEWEPFPLVSPNPDGEADRTRLGLFLSPSSQGSRGVSLQYQLGLEARYGTCDIGQTDYITRLVAARSGATVEALLHSLLDRLVGLENLSAESVNALAGLLGVPASTSANEVDAASLERGLRMACGVVAFSAPHMSAVLPPNPKPVEGVHSVLPDDQLPATCGRVAASINATQADFTAICGSDGLVVSRAR